MPDGPVLNTARLVLRPPALEDFPRWAEHMADPSTHFVGGPITASEAWRAMMSTAGAWALTGVAMFSVIERASGIWVGRVGPLNPHGWPAPEVGWCLHHDARGRGYAVEAAAAAMDYAVETLGWDDVIHVIDPLNTASAAVATRLGSALRGPVRLPAPYDDAVVDAWGQTAAAWRARRA